jgi:hypothetical protein
MAEHGSLVGQFGQANRDPTTIQDSHTNRTGHIRLENQDRTTVTDRSRQISLKGHPGLDTERAGRPEHDSKDRPARQCLQTYIFYKNIPDFHQMFCENISKNQHFRQNFRENV